MSMNLHLEINGKKIELLQTPTMITNMCMCSDVGVECELTGKKAVRAVRTYLSWVMGSANGSWENMESLNIQREKIRIEVERIESLLVDAKRIKVFSA